MPIKNPETAKDITKRVLESSAIISARELLSIVPDIWKNSKELVMTRCVPQTVTAAFVEEERPNKPIKMLLNSMVTRENGLIVTREVENL